MSDPSGNEVVRKEIARRAYVRFCDRGCVDGSDLDDWLVAERAVLAEQQKGPTHVTKQADPRPRRSRKSRR